MEYKSLTCLALSLSGSIFLQAQNQKERAKPNIVVIITDQQYVGKMSYMGDKWLSTPTMDNIAQNGYSFTKSYCAFPLCVPSRFSMFTGQYPSSYNVRVNPDKEENVKVNLEKIKRLEPLMLANVFTRAGYDTYYGGKVHLPSAQSNEDATKYGFRNIYSTERRTELGRDASSFLATKSKGDKPFLMVVSYINPHDICEYDDFVKFDSLSPAKLKAKAEGIKRVRKYVNLAEQIPQQKFYDEVCPPLIENHELTTSEPNSLPGKIAPYTEKQWRMRRWVYDRLTEEVDSDIAPVIVALKKGGFLDNTIIVFTSDHGEMDGAHEHQHKIVPYRECQNVPFIFSGPGILKQITDKTNMVNNGIDLLPTLCDLAGIPIPGNYPGKSLKPLISGEKKKLDREYLFCEGPNWYQVVKQGRYKYTVLEGPGNPDMLVDLDNDPGELTNFASNPKQAALKSHLKEVLFKSLSERGIKLNSK
jgi:choline-sulfatase